MRISDKYIALFSGYIRFKTKSNKFSIEINWRLDNWAIPLNIDLYGNYYLDIRLFCVSFIILYK